VSPLDRELIAGLGQHPPAEGTAHSLRGHRDLAPFVVQPPPLAEHRWLAAPNTTLDQDPLPSDPAAALFAGGLLLRLNFLYRDRTAQLLDRFYAAAGPRFDPLQPPICVAAHLRRGDRLPGFARVNMTTYCLNESRGGPCLQSDGRTLGPCDVHLGCRDGVPFALVELQHVLDKAALLAGPTARTVLLFSDDSAWLQQQVAALEPSHPDWTLLLLPPLSPPPGPPQGERLVAEPYEGHNFLRFQAGTQSGVHFLASLQLASRCGSLVGHFASGATRLFYSAMCLQHAAPGLGSDGVVQGVCPPAYDFRRGLRTPQTPRESHTT